MQSPILQPVVGLVLWSLIMWVWMYAVRLPAMRKANTPLTPETTKEDMNATMPARARWPADNYNHLMEQPTLFYAVALVLALVGAGDGANLWLAWAYVGLRVLHSLVQAAANLIQVRFAVFVLGTGVLAAMAVRAAGVVWG